MHFRTPYVLCGEIMKTFRKDREGHDDISQIVAYTRHRPDPPDAGYDVLLLVGTHSDDVAAKALQRARRSKLPEQQPEAPVVVVGFYLESERVRGEWYDLKWRDQPGNSRFTHPNVSSDLKATALNKLITRAAHCAIRVDRPALIGVGRSPLINDEPPPFYMLVRILIPALNELLTDNERDTLRAQGKVEKILSRDDLQQAQIIASVAPPARYLQRALDLLVSVGHARRVTDGETTKYAITVDTRVLGRDLKQLISAKHAALLVRSLKFRGRSRGKATRVSEKQLRLL